MERHYKINDYLSLVLQGGKTKIYINNKLFIQCKSILFHLSTDDMGEIYEFNSVDELIQSYTHKKQKPNKALTPELEFWGHCSNLQAWYEHEYDTKLIHSNLAFPLLKKLGEVGDLQARRVYKEELAKRVEQGSPTTIKYLILESFIWDLPHDFLYELIQDKIFKDVFIEIFQNDLVQEDNINDNLLKRITLVYYINELNKSKINLYSLIELYLKLQRVGKFELAYIWLMFSKILIEKLEYDKNNVQQLIKIIEIKEIINYSKLIDNILLPILENYIKKDKFIVNLLSTITSSTNKNFILILNFSLIICKSPRLILNEEIKLALKQINTEISIKIREIKKKEISYIKSLIIKTKKELSRVINSDDITPVSSVDFF